MMNRNEGHMATVYIVDDDEGMRDSLRLLLTSIGLNAEVYQYPTEFLEQSRISDHACLVTDLRMPVMNGIELIEAVRKKGWSIPMIVISAHGDIRYAVRALRLGAIDFIEKPFNDQDLLDAIQNALKVPADPVAPKVDCDVHAAAFDKLTRREREVLTLVVAGKPNKLISRALAISTRTVEAHRANLMHKLHVSSVAELVSIAVRHDFESGVKSNE
jgi:FixJ family two-component response regulator